MNFLNITKYSIFYKELDRHKKDNLRKLKREYV